MSLVRVDCGGVRCRSVPELSYDLAREGMPPRGNNEALKCCWNCAVSIADVGLQSSAKNEVVPRHDVKGGHLDRLPAVQLEGLPVLVARWMRKALREMLKAGILLGQGADRQRGEHLWKVRERAGYRFLLVRDLFATFGPPGEIR